MISKANKKTILIMGGTGLIGSHFIKIFNDTYNFIIITRNKNKIKAAKHNHQMILWDEFLNNKISFIEKSDIIINLAGESLLKPLTKHNKEIIYNSRIKTTKEVIQAINQANKKPTCLINASAIGYYQHHNYNKEFTELSKPGNDLISQLCIDWEYEAKQTKVRSIQLRIGLVLDAKNGFLKTLLTPFNLFIGGHLGDGKQNCPWIHNDDVSHIINYIIENNSINGPVNVVSPNQCTLKKFCKTLSQIINRPSWLHIPKFIIKILFKELAPTLLNTPLIKPEKLLATNYKFIHQDLTKTLKYTLK